MRARGVIAIGVVTAALVVLAAGAGPSSALQPPPAFTPVMLLGFTVLAAATAAAYQRSRSVVLASITGVAFSGAALSARAAHGAGDWVVLLHAPLTWAALQPER